MLSLKELEIAKCLPFGKMAGPKSVFAHFIVGNANAYGQSDWVDDMRLAQAAGIDAFALNVGATDQTTTTQVPQAYTAAAQIGFKVFLSFDYAAQGPWSSQAVINTIRAYANSPGQFKVNGLPLVSTFEGTAKASDWATIRHSTPLFLVPEWTSIDPNDFKSSDEQYVDGIFSWDAWSQGAVDKTDDSDKAWQSAAAPKAYMMPVSPWFYTNLPQYGKNWVWRGDDMWHNRWQQVLQVQPQFVEILTWNDYGESHYIGPIREQGVPKGAQKYVDNMPHDHWRDLLPYYIQAYKTGQPGITKEKLHFWYRLSPATAGSSDGTAGNAPWQPSTSPNVVVQDKVFFTALLTSPATVTVQIGSNETDILSSNAVGAFHSSVPFNARTGAVKVSIVRGSSVVVSEAGPAITSSPPNGLTNYNAWVGGSG